MVGSQRAELCTEMVMVKLWMDLSYTEFCFLSIDEVPQNVRLFKLIALRV